MRCDESEVMLHALIDGELDAGHARDVEAHVSDCAGCAEKFATFRTMHDVMSAAPLKEIAPAHLRNRIEALMATPEGRIVSMRQFLRPTRRSFFGARHPIKCAYNSANTKSARLSSSHIANCTSLGMPMHLRPVS